MMQMMKMKNMMKNDDYSSSSYDSDNAFDMFSDMFDSYEQKDNYRSSSDYKNPMGRMSQFKNMFNSMRFKRAGGEAGRAEAPHGGQDRQHDLCHEGVERLGRQQQHRCAGHEEGHPEVHHAQRVVQEQVRAPA